jgi:hypothetical protein
MVAGGNPLLWSDRVRWPIVFLEQALILILGGGLLTWVVRRERRSSTGSFRHPGERFEPCPPI